MSEEPKKKIMIKRKGGTKPAIRLNKPAGEEEEAPPVEESAPAVDAAGRKKVAFKKRSIAPKSEAEKKSAEQPPEAEPAPAEDKEAAATPVEKSEKPSVDAGSKTEKVEGTVFKFYCVYCGQKLSAYDTMAGKKITCPSCQNKIEIPVPPA